jgi:cytochrome c1
MKLASNLSSRERRLVFSLAPALLLIAGLRYTVFDDAAPAPAANPDNIALAQQRAARIRQIAALVPAREAVFKQTASDLADRERGIIQADTAPQAQASLLEIARRVGKGQQIDVRGAELGAPKAFGDYGLVYATVTFECHVEQLVNFLADLSHQPELIVPSEERIVSGNPKEKLMNARIVLAGIVLKKLVPEKKALGAF